MFYTSCGYSEIVQYQNCMEILVVKKKYEKAVIKYHWLQWGILLQKDGVALLDF